MGLGKGLINKPGVAEKIQRTLRAQQKAGVGLVQRRSDGVYVRRFYDGREVILDIKDRDDARGPNLGDTNIVDALSVPGISEVDIPLEKSSIKSKAPMLHDFRHAAMHRIADWPILAKAAQHTNAKRLDSRAVAGLYARIAEEDWDAMSRDERDFADAALRAHPPRA